MNLDDVIKKLEYYDERLPKAEIEYALSHQKEITPKLYEFLEYTVEHFREIISDEDDFYGYMYAIYILAVFKDQKLFPFLIDLIEMGDEELDYLLGDCYLEDLPRLLASSYNNDDESLINILKDKNADFCIRSSIITTFSILYLEGVKSRDFLINLFKEIISNIEDEPNDFCELILYGITDIKLIELADDVEKNLFIHIGDEDIINDFKLMVKEGDTSLNRDDSPLYKHYEYMNNIIDIMDDWQCFRYWEDEEYKKSKNCQQVNRLINSRQKKSIVGKNELCYCGSGKEYKKCCINKKNESEFDTIDCLVCRAKWHEDRCENKRAMEYYRYAYFDIISYCEKHNIKIVEDIDYKWKCYDYFSNWVQDYFMLLEDKTEKNAFYDRLSLYDFFESAFDLNDVDNQYWKELILRKKANALYLIGNEKEATKLIGDYLKENPLWIWGYIEMSDWYTSYDETNTEKAISILEKAIEAGIVEDIDLVYGKLENLYLTTNDEKKLNELRKKQKDL